MKYVLGLDIGSTGAKSLLVNSHGEVVSSASADYPTDTPKPLWSEQDPEHWWQPAQIVFNKQLVTLASTEGTPYGAALQAGEGTGVYPNIRDACNKRIKIATRTTPTPRNTITYEECLGVYREMYSVLRNSFTSISQVVIKDVQ